MKTYSTRIGDIQHEWHVVDATDQILGRLATKVAGLLMGKHKPLFTSNLDTGDYVIVLNASKVKVSGKKMQDKLYYRHSMYPGGLKSESLREMMQKHPDRVIEHAVKGMLPHNKLGSAMLKKLKVYANDKHPHEAQTNTVQKAKGEVS